MSVWLLRDVHDEWDFFRSGLDVSGFVIEEVSACGPPGAPVSEGLIPLQAETEGDAPWRGVHRQIR